MFPQKLDRMISKTRRAFTLVEMVVVIAVVALLSAIIVPLVAKQIDDSKIAKAKNELVVMAAAINKFRIDVGLWPGMVSGAVNVLTLVSGTAVDADVDPDNDALDYGFAGAGNEGWYCNSCADPGAADTFDNSLNVNSFQGNDDLYPTTGETRWKGPYLPPIGMDPWGRPYMCNIGAAFMESGNLVVVMSAGPNGIIDTTYDEDHYGAASTVAAPSGDDIWVVIYIKP